MKLRLLCLGLVALPLLLFCQEYRATISGVVNDASGSAIPGAKVLVTEANTGTRFETSSGAEGQYTAPSLLPGDYDIVVRLQGFKESVRKGIHVGAGEHPVIDMQLQVGDATQAVEVTSDVPLVNIENASVGQAITTKEVEDLPINGGTPLTLSALAIGVVATGQPSQIQPFASGGAAGWSIGGSAAQTNEILVNGSPDSTWDGRLAYSPPKDAVQEVRIKAFDSDAGYGHTGGGTLNQILKSGTNQIHGSVQELNQPNTLTANNFFNNKAGLGNPVTHYNQYGATLGGPVVLPKLYNGKNKLFWFFAYEGVKDSTPNTAFLTVPTEKERQGDFSDLLKLPNGSAYQLYDPYTAVQNGSTITRSPYPNNVIPTSQLNPVALAILKLYPLPNIAPQRADGYNNYGNTAPTTDNYNNYLGRIDFNASDRNRLFFDVRHTDYLQVKNNYFNNLATGSLLTRNNIGASLDYVYTLNATNVFNLRLNFTRMDEAHPSPSAGFDPTSLGLPSYLAGNSRYLQLPYVSFNSNSGFQALGNNASDVIPSQSAQIYANWVTIRGAHTIKTGIDVRQYQLNATSYNNSVGAFSFSNNNWVRSASNASSTVVLGQDFASFLLGLPTGGSYDINASGSYYQRYLAGFIQDDWRVRRNLTLNLGLRFDHDGPFREKYARTLNGFDPNTANPLAAAAVAAYAKSPSPLLPASAFRVNGGPTFASSSDNAIYQTTSRLFSPRVGFAWQPDIFRGKTSIRGGFGMFVSPVTMASLSLNGNYSTKPILTQEGFSQSTALNPTNNNYLTPFATLSNPFPTAIQQPAGSSAGLGTFAGQTLSILNPQMSNPYSLRWNFGFQQELARNTMLEVVYIGNHGVHLPVAVTQLNGLPRQYLSTSPDRDQTLINALTATVANPFLGLASSQGTASTITTAQLLAPFPQYPAGANSGSSGVLLQNATIGSSYYHALNIRLQKRFSSGLTLVGNYIHSKLIERTSWLNDSDPAPEKRISAYDHPNRFVMATMYELPFGHGRRFDLGSRVANGAFGGWSINGIYTYQTGAPLTWVNGSTTTPGDYIYYGGPLNLNNRETNTTAFNTAQFNTIAAQQYQYHIRTFATTFDNLRQDGINQFDASILKRFFFTEKTYLQLRGEAFNVLNHPTLAAPNTTVTNSAFGTITAQSNRTRSIQVGARIVF